MENNSNSTIKVFQEGTIRRVTYLSFKSLLSLQSRRKGHATFLITIHQCYSNIQRGRYKFLTQNIRAFFRQPLPSSEISSPTSPCLAQYTLAILSILWFPTHTLECFVHTLFSAHADPVSGRPLYSQVPDIHINPKRLTSTY